MNSKTRPRFLPRSVPFPPGTVPFELPGVQALRHFFVTYGASARQADSRPGLLPSPRLGCDRRIYGGDCACNRDRGGTRRWQVDADFPPHAYTREPQRMVIRDESGHEAVLEDIPIGDVWLIGGQSNAELTLAPCMTMTPSVEFSRGGQLPAVHADAGVCCRQPVYCEQPQLDIINPAWCWKRPGARHRWSFPRWAGTSPASLQSRSTCRWGLS